MIENTLLKFIAELHKVLEEEPNSYTASILKNALPEQAIYPSQTEHLFAEYAYIFKADTELEGNDIIIEHFLENFPYARALFGSEGDQKFFSNRFVNDFRDNYLVPKLYLVNEETEHSLEDQELQAVSANQIQDPETGQVHTEVYAQNQEGNTFRLLYSDEGSLLSMEDAPNFASRDLLYNAGQAPSTLPPLSTTETTESETHSESSIQTHEESFDTHILTQAEELTDAQLNLEYAAQAHAEEELETEEALQAKAELETIQRNKQEYERAEASRIERLNYERKQQEQARNQQRQSKTAKRMAIAAGTGATIFSGGLASIIIGGDLIGLF